MKKICIIGCNYGTNVVLKSLSGFKKKILIKGISGNKERGKKFLGIDYFKNWKYMINKLKPDLVIIAVPPKIQSSIICHLLKNNIDFMCEKPLTINYKVLTKIISLKVNSKSKNFVDLNFLTIPAILKMKNIIGKNISSSNKILFKWYINPKSSNKQTWKNNELVGGGELNNFFFHVVSILNYWFGNDYKLKIKENNKNLYIINFKNKNVSFDIIFAINKFKNLFYFHISNKNHKYILKNNSLDYHNNFKILKDGDYIYNKKFKRNMSRILTTRKVLKSYFDKRMNSKFSLLNSIDIQKKIFNLQSA